MGNVRSSDAVVEQRRRAVLQHVIEHGGARIDELAERFEASLMTMHRDLDELAERQLLRKLRGRVESYPSLTVETATRFRVGLRVAEKEALATAAAAEVRPGMTVLIDDSGTVFPLAKGISAVDRLTVVTNSVAVAQILADTGREVVLLGGRYRGEFDSCTGPDVLRALARLRADVSFTSATAIADGQLFHPIQDYADIKEAVIESAAHNVLLVDHSKFGKTATFRLPRRRLLRPGRHRRRHSRARTGCNPRRRHRSAGRAAARNQTPIRGKQLMNSTVVSIGAPR